MPLLNKFRETINRYKLLKKGDKVLIAVSGGPDSVALLYLLRDFSRELRLKLHIAHLDHCLRKGSFKDREFVEFLSRKLKIPFTYAQINVAELAKKGSIEEIARNARLGFLFKVAKDIKADKIALGHTQDDQAETVLMRILRGAGLYGLSGILPQRNIAGNILIRPLIEIERKEVEIFLQKRKINACRDASNFEDIYLRNKIRNKLLPLLKKEYNPNIKETLANMAQSVGADYDYLNQAVFRLFNRIPAKLNLTKFLKLHPAIQRLVLRNAIASLKGNTRRINFQHIKEIEDLILNRPVNSVVHLPAGISVIKKKAYLCIKKNCRL